jgi:hypothetical protein
MVRYLDSPTNDTLANWYSFKAYGSNEDDFADLSGGMGVFVNQTTVVGVSRAGEVRIIFGSLGHKIAPDFKLRKNRPKTYIPFLKTKLFHLRDRQFTFSRRQGDTLVFEVEHASGGRAEYYLDTRLPDKRGYYKTIYVPPRPEKPPGGWPPSPLLRYYKMPLEFAGLADKERYMKDALMRNLYLYRLHQREDLAERLNLDTLDGAVRPGPSSLDSLLPDFDEYIGEIELYKRFCCDDKGEGGRGCRPYPYTRALYEEGRPLPYPLRKQVGWIGPLTIGYVEFYAFIKSQKEALYKRSGGSFEAVREALPARWRPTLRQGREAWYRYDAFHLPGLSGEAAPPVPIDADRLYPENCSRSRPFRSAYDDLQEPASFYLLALNTLTRKVYFISGEGIYLSPATNLYQSGPHPYKPNVNPNTGEPVEWQLWMKLAYIRARLHQYLVEELSEQHIVEMDSEKIVVEVSGRDIPFRARPYRLRATFYEQNPEVLEIEELE